MPVQPFTQWTESRTLPDYHALLAVDAEGFTRLPSVQHPMVSTLIPSLVDTALTAAGLPQVRDGKAFPAHTGDGVAFGFAPALLPYAVWPFLDVLNGILSRHNARGAGPRIRLRVALHVGPLPDGKGPEAGNGTARNDTHRLLGSDQVRHYLAESCEESTPVAAIISHRVYEDVILAGYTGLHPRRCIDVTATVPDKHFAQSAWLYVPSPSGNLLGSTGGSGDGSADEAPRTSARDARREEGAGRAEDTQGRVNQRVQEGAALVGDVTGGLRVTTGGGPAASPGKRR
ncbi:hypothetical protein ACWGJ2_15225 [Streptomyces sp. NPDC054796]